MRALQLVTLGDAGRHYLSHALAMGYSLANGLHDRIGSSDGVLFTLLPQTVTQDKALAFDQGGLTFPDDLRRAQPAPEALTRHLPAMDTILAALASELSSRTDAQLLVAENAQAKPADPWLVSARSEIFFREAEVFHYVAGSPIPEAQALDVIAEASAPFSAILALSPTPRSGWPPGPDRYLTNVDALITIAKEAALVAAAAYDGEGYVFWTPVDRYPVVLSILKEWYELEEVS